MKNKSILQNWLLRIAGFILAILLLSAPKQAEAQVAEGFVGPEHGQSIVYTTNPTGTDTTSDVANIYIPKKDVWYWTTPLPNGVSPGDTCPVWAIDTLGERADTWVEVTGAGGHKVITLYPGGYTGTISDINNCSDTLVSANLVVKHNGNYSDTLTDTFNIDVGNYHDIYFNLAKSGSVQVWSNNGDWDQLFGDSVFVTANAINYE